MKRDTATVIIDTATETLIAKGYNGCGINEILATARVPKGSFYHYFDSKEALVETVLKRYGQENYAWLATHLEDESIPPIDAIGITFRLASNAIAERKFAVGCLLGSMAQELANTEAPIVATIRGLFRTWEAPLRSAVERAKRKGDIRADINAGSLASFILNGWEGAVLRAKLDRASAPMESFVDHIVRYLQLLS
jgi:TetR/AcrR family transcriptional regulator, transcriptional repressor for nem operon